MPAVPPTSLVPTAHPTQTVEAAEQRPSLTFLFAAFLKAGCLGFGGFLSLISMVETVLVKQRKLMTSEQMLDGVSLASLLPGPQAVNVVAYCGHKLRGWRGAWVAGVAVVLPSFVAMLVLSILYQRYGKLDGVTRLFHGFIPAVAAVIASVVWRMAKQALKTRVEIALAISAAVVLTLASFGLLGFPRSAQLYVTFGLVVVCGVAGYALFRSSSGAAKPATTRFPAVKLAITAAGAVLLAVVGLAQPFADTQSDGALATTFSGLSVMLFGGGYVFIPMIQHHVVDGLGWVTQKEFLDGIALSQVMPGPILVAATFIGWKVTGFSGALLSTIAIFTPPAIVMVVASQALEHVQRSPAAKAVMRGIRCAVVGMIAVAALVVFKSALPADQADVRSVVVALVLFAGALVALLRFKVDVVWVIPASGALGWFLFR